MSSLFLFLFRTCARDARLYNWLPRYYRWSTNDNRFFWYNTWCFGVTLQPSSDHINETVVMLCSGHPQKTLDVIFNGRWSSYFVRTRNEHAFCWTRKFEKLLRVLRHFPAMATLRAWFTPFSPSNLSAYQIGTRKIEEGRFIDWRRRVRDAFRSWRHWHPINWAIPIIARRLVGTRIRCSRFIFRLFVFFVRSRVFAIYSRMVCRDVNNGRDGIFTQTHCNRYFTIQLLLLDFNNN